MYCKTFTAVIVAASQLDRVFATDIRKHSSLLQYGRKSFIAQALGLKFWPWANGLAY